MPIELSELEQGIIKNELLRKSHKDIADLLELPVEDISLFICHTVKGTNIVTKQMQLDQKRLQVKTAKPKAVKQEVSPAPKKTKPLTKAAVKKQQDKSFQESLKKQKKAAHWEQQNMLAAARNAKKPRMYSTIHVDYNSMRTIRIDRKTVIYAKAGETDDQAKKRFLKNYSKLLFKNLD